MRVGSPKLDNTREVRENSSGGGYQYISNNLVLDDNSKAIKLELWNKTDEAYKNAAKQLEQVKANVAVKVAAEDKSDDFSLEPAETYYEKPLSLKELKFDDKKWEERMRKFNDILSNNKDIIQWGSNLNIEVLRKYFVDSEGAQIAENNINYRISFSASSVAEDGMRLPLYKSYYANDPKDLPSEDEIMKDIKEMSQMLTDLKNAPLAESFTGPAIMNPEAAGVFFHEIFGHRIEGYRLKKEADAQTFKKKVGEMILPEDFSIVFDPQAKKHKGFPLNGSYVYDDEGVKGQKVTIIENGKLKSFLMSRSPIEGFSNSNGHGRGMIYLNPVTRQSNMFIESSKPKSDQELKNLLIEELKKTNKEYGYYFGQVSGGFTTTGRYMPNAFNVKPLVVYKIYADGRPDELVRGVDLVGTPLAMFSQIAACGNKFGVFNGTCGAESGSVPVSSVSPALYVKMIETQKQAKSQSQPPILEKPTR